MIPDAALSAARHAYFAHRFELSEPGRHDHLYSHDLVAAYPWATTHLPCFAHGEWFPAADHMWTDQLVPGAVTMRLVRWQVPPQKIRPFAPFPWRYPDGGQIYPRNGAGWVWSPEWDSATRHWPAEWFKVLDAWTFIPGCQCQPWAWLHDLLEARAAFPPLKRFMNAVPGKLAQSRPHPGPWMDPVAAGLVTSIVRARMLDAAVSVGSSAVAITADCIWTRRRLPPGSGLSGQPGSWRVNEHHDVLMVQPSVIFEGERIHAGAGTPATCLEPYVQHFRVAWDQAHLDAVVQLPYRHFVTVAESYATNWTVPFGRWTESLHDVAFSTGRKRTACLTRDGVPVIEKGRALTRPQYDPPDVSAFAAASSIVDDSWLSSPYWDKSMQACMEPPETWPTPMDSLDA